jgi:cytoskeletal protein CcmA (bactofilin family)
VHIEENAQVEADITAEEVVIAGEYTGKLTCRQRVEIRATGRVSGTIDTAKLLLHEGGYFDGELHMQKTTPNPAASTPGTPSASRSDSDERPRRTRYVDIAGDNSSREVGSSDSSS